MGRVKMFLKFKGTRGTAAGMKGICVDLSTQNVAQSEKIWAMPGDGGLMRYEKFQKPEHSYP